MRIDQVHFLASLVITKVYKSVMARTECHRTIVWGLEHPLLYTGSASSNSPLLVGVETCGLTRLHYRNEHGSYMCYDFE